MDCCESIAVTLFEKYDAFVAKYPSLEKARVTVEMSRLAIPSNLPYADIVRIRVAPDWPD